MRELLSMVQISNMFRGGWRQRRLGWLAGLVVGLGILPALGGGRPAIAAERITLYFGPLQFSLSVDALETFAQDGTVTREFALYANRLNPKTLSQLREILQQRVDEGPAIVAQFAYATMGEALLQRLGNLIQTRSGLNGFYAIRSALILAAADDSEGLSVLNVIRHFPGSDIRVNTASLFQLTEELALLSDYRQAVIDAIAQQAESEATADLTAGLPANFAQLPDLQQPGAYGVLKKELTFQIQSHPVLATDTSDPLHLNLYLPQGVAQPAPLVVLTHPLGGSRHGFSYLGEHLASHGIALAIPEHVGSNGSRLKAFMQGETLNLIEATEYLRRTHEISALLDELEHLATLNPALGNQLDLQRVGIIGSSFGGTTALSLVGADINRARLQQNCVTADLTLNLSILLQCRAHDLPPIELDLQDTRIQAAIAMFPPASTIFGPESMANIDIPLMLVAASQDVLAPTVEEQIHPFAWLTSPDKYLAVMDPANHYVIDSVGSENRAPAFLKATRPDPRIGRGYIQALSGAHLSVVGEVF
ncbi:MAG: alpha/beta hydrolase [Cyanothece sp. SIO1E1]|nr:alpha/beta hydrolase [Cyanothece sp. SIO1E1]